MPEVSLDLRYDGESIALYEFENFAEANDFLVKAKLLADSLAKSVVTVKVTTSQCRLVEGDEEATEDLFTSASLRE